MGAAPCDSLNPRPAWAALQPQRRMIPSAEKSRVALVTGAAGGLGQALVSELAAQGWKVVAGWHTAEPRSDHPAVWPVKMDVTDRGAILSTVDQILGRWGRIDLLINNAGCTADQSTWQIREEDWERVLNVNLKGAFMCAQAVLHSMVRQRDGHILNVASYAARAGTRGQAAYAAAKAGVIGLTESLAKEVGPHNVRVNAVLPGVLPTPMTTKLSAATLAQFAAANALGRLNSVAEVARFIVFLAGTADISGQLFQLDSRIARWA